MGDIYDDIDEILGADDELDTASASLEDDKNFNESELEDIMSEIESLEKDFDSGSDAILTRNPLQDEVEKELAESMAFAEETTESTESAVAESPKTQLLAFDKPKVAARTIAAPATTSATSSASGVSFSAQGSMALSLDFKIGEESAKLTIDPIAGLTVTLSGVELVINETDGCHVTMDNGMKFTIPLSSLEKTHKKKAA